VLHGAYRLREGTATFTLSVAEDVGSTFLWNVSKHLPEHTASHHIKQ
jgi:hypothetical protein